MTARSLSRPAPAARRRPLVSILVISYNTREMTLDCLRERRRRDHGALRAHRPRQRLEGRLGGGDRRRPSPDIRLIASRGEPRLRPRQQRRRRAGARGKYVLLLNPDTLVLDHALDRIVAFAERTPEAGIWGGRTLQRRPQPEPDQRLRRHDALEPVLPRLRAGAGLPEERLLQPRVLRRLAARQRARGRRGDGLLLPDPPRRLGGARRPRPDLRDVRRGGRPLPPRPGRAAPGRG